MRFRLRIVLAAHAVFLVGLLTGPVMSGRANAAISGCRTDPIVHLSNGAQVQVTANIGTADSNVKSISYALHGPLGTTVTQVVYTSGSIGAKESFKYYADQTGQGYSSDTVVNTATSPVTITATTSVVSGPSGSVTGLNKQDLIVNL